jgi:ADP-ribose pyrophosphatase YjhB (NUDIX family)
LREDIFLLGPLVARVFQRYWRLTRGLRLAVEACVIDSTGRILMVRDGASGGWSLPKGAVHKGETLEGALRRVLRDIASIEVNSIPELSCFYAEGRDRQTGIYVVRDWKRLSSPASPETNFFGLGSLPPDTAPEAAERIRRSAEGRTIPEV